MSRMNLLLVLPFLVAGAAVADMPKPKLIIAISVDQFSANLFDEYRPSFTGGLKRLSSGIAFNNGYQSHAATETCPGHSTILTGDHPARTGIIANNWLDLDVKREDKGIYCVEDEAAAGSSSKNYTVSPETDVSRIAHRWCIWQRSRRHHDFGSHARSNLVVDEQKLSV